MKKRQRKTDSKAESRTFLGAALTHLIEKRGLTVRGIAKAMGEPASKPSRLARGELRCDRDALDRLLRSFPAKIDQAELTMAHVRDNVSTAAWKTLKHYQKPTPPTPSPNVWTQQGLNAWTSLQQAPEDMQGGIERLVIDIARMYARLNPPPE